MVKVDMEMPKNCAGCPMSWSENGYKYYCRLIKKDIYTGTGENEYRPKDCPIIEELPMRLRVNCSALTEEEIRDFMEFVCKQRDYNGFKSCQIGRVNNTVTIRSDVKNEFDKFVNNELDNYAIDKNVYVFRAFEFDKPDCINVIMRPKRPKQD